MIITKETFKEKLTSHLTSLVNCQSTTVVSLPEVISVDGSIRFDDCEFNLDSNEIKYIGTNRDLSFYGSTGLSDLPQLLVDGELILQRSEVKSLHTYSCIGMLSTRESNLVSIPSSCWIGKLYDLNSKLTYIGEGTKIQKLYLAASSPLLNALDFNKVDVKDLFLFGNGGVVTLPSSLKVAGDLTIYRSSYSINDSGNIYVGGQIKETNEIQFY